MTLPGETEGFDGATCDCGKCLDLQVCRSAAGFYLGYVCPDCGPWSRETGYYGTRAAAEAELAVVEMGGVPANLRW